jgi:hypothetical protein
MHSHKADKKGWHTATPGTCFHAGNGYWIGLTLIVTTVAWGQSWSSITRERDIDQIENLVDIPRLIPLVLCTDLSVSIC